MKLYHCSTWQHLTTLAPGDVFTLVPDPQGAEGPGVYFSEGVAAPAASDSCHLAGEVASVVSIDVSPTDLPGWWASKPGKSRKFGKSRTWHTNGQSLTLRVVAVSQMLECTISALDAE